MSFILVLPCKNGYSQPICDCSLGQLSLLVAISFAVAVQSKIELLCASLLLLFRKNLLIFANYTIFEQ